MQQSQTPAWRQLQMEEAASLKLHQLWVGVTTIMFCQRQWNCRILNFCWVIVF